MIGARPCAVAGRTLCAVVMLLAASLLAAEPDVPSQAHIAGCDVDPVSGTPGGAVANLRVSCEDVVELLARARVVSEHQWRHEYGHVAFGDRTGHLTLRDGSALRWLLRPGGLAVVEWPDGRRTYLVRCCAE